MSDPNIREKSAILYRNGFLRDQDRANKARIEGRWHIYQTVTQKTIRSKVKPERAAAD